jgi:hypothetical protein
MIHLHFQIIMKRVEITEEIVPLNEVEGSLIGASDLESANSGARCYPYKNHTRMV